MAGLTLELLGPPQLRLNNISVTPNRRAVIALLAYLAVSNLDHPNSRHTRESLSTLFWADYNQSQALAHLRQTLWSVTKFIGDGWILSDHQTICLNPNADINLDVNHFRSMLTRASQQLTSSLRLPLLLAATKLYRDNFLTGFSLKDAPEFDDWILAEAEKLRRDFSSILSLLIEDYSRLNQAESAIPYAHRLVTLDPMNETSHSQLIQLYALTGQHTHAVQHYKTLEKLLRRELNVDPQPETRELYKKIRRGEFTVAFMEEKQDQLKKNIPRHNLPVHLTRFIGREKERDQLCKLLKHNRLVTLVGSGGIGKTRLALQTGQLLISDSKHDVWFIPLDPLSEEDLVPKTVASSLGIAERPGETVLEALVKVLSDQNSLLIFDNCEHLLDACARLGEFLLKSCPQLKILATSRDVLGLEGEAVYRLPPMDLPQVDDTKSLDELAQYDSIRLFVDRAGLVVPGFELTEENSEAIVGICHRLDGLPLAIELASARLKMMSMAEIATRLNDRFNLLTTGSRMVLPRHQTLRASIDWSYDLLTEPEKILSRRLSVFAGGFTLEAAKAICGRERLKAHDILGLLSRLVDKSLVHVEKIMPKGDTRYRVLETIREYLILRLQESNETALIHEEHLKYFTKWIAECGQKLLSEEQALWFSRINIEMDNLRAALDWSTLDLSQEASPSQKASQRIELCYRLGDVLNWQAKYTDAVNIYQVMLISAQDLGDFVAQSRAFQGKAHTLEIAGEYRDSINYALQAETLARNAGTSIELSKALRTQGIARYRLGQAQATFLLGEEALSIAKELDHQDEMARCLTLLGGATYILGKYNLAERYWIEALSTFQALGNKRQANTLLNNLGAIADARGDYQTAFQRYDSALRIAREIRDRDSELLLLSNRGGEQVALRNYVAAEADLRKTIEMAASDGSWCLPNTYVSLAEAYLGQGHIERALEAALQAMALALKSDASEFIGVTWRVLGLISVQMGEPIAIKFKKTTEPIKFTVRECFEISEEIFIANRIDGERARTLREWARSEIQMGNKERGAAFWQEARQLFEKVGAIFEIERMSTLPM